MTWMIGDDLESDIVGAQACGPAHGARADGEVPPGAGRALARPPEGIVSSIAQLPEWIEEHL